VTERPNPDAAERWAEVEELFLEALERSPTARRELLEARCQGDPELRREVESLLVASETEGVVPDRLDDVPFGGRFPERIGDYRIVRPLGEGGMGVVFLAVRETAGFDQTVALKLLRGSFVDPLLASRLEEERRILARLEHPGIARLIDGGVTSGGEPYYAMEYVEGEDLLTYCDRRTLEIDERIRLFREVCEAVHYAHQQLVVHRDLKPSNILVTPEGRVKLLDFGIARDVEADGSSQHTGRWVTPAYASPEQVTGGRMSTLSDVYSLGILLCELLAGARPYSTDATSPAELARVIAEEPPIRPSRLVEGGEGTEEAAGSRRTSPGRLARNLSGDLDLITLTALAKEPDRRYGSAKRLAEDLGRFLEGRPIEARPDSRGYRLRKFVERHRAGVAAGIVLVAVLVAGVTATLWQARVAESQRDRAEEEAVRAQQVTALMTEIFRLGDPTRTLGDTIGVRQVLDQGAIRVDETLGHDPELQATLFLELGRVYANLGILAEADRLASRSVELRSEALPGTLALAEAMGFRAHLARAEGRGPEAIRLLEEAMDLREGLLAEPDTALASLQAALAWEVRAGGDFPRAGELFTAAMETQRTLLGPDHVAVAGSMLGLASTFHDQGSFDEAEALFRAALEGGGVRQADPVSAAALVNLAMIRRLREEYVEAEPLIRSGLEMRQALYDPDHPDVIEAMEQWGAELFSLGRLRESESVYVETLERSIRILGEAHPRTRSTREGLAGVDWTMGRYDLAVARTDSVIEAKILAHRGDHPGTVYSLVRSGDILVEARRPDEAEARYRQGLAMGERLGGTQGVYGALARTGLGKVALLRGNLAEADSLNAAALDLASSNLRETHRYIRDIRRARGDLLIEEGDPPRAAEILEAVAGAERGVHGGPNWLLGRTLSLLGEAHLGQGDREGAEAAFRESLEHFAELPREHWWVGVSLVGLAQAQEGRAPADSVAALRARGIRVVQAHLAPSTVPVRLPSGPGGSPDPAGR
jgi:serine/threonine-protein kinase